MEKGVVALWEIEEDGHLVEWDKGSRYRRRWTIHKRGEQVDASPSGVK